MELIFRGINFREFVIFKEFRGINFREFEAQNSRKLIPRKLIPLKQTEKVYGLLKRISLFVSVYRGTN